MRYEHECNQCPARDRHLKKGRKYKRRLIWHYIKAKWRGEPFYFPCWPRKAYEQNRERSAKGLPPIFPSLATGTHPTVKRPMAAPPLRYGPSGDSGEPVADDRVAGQKARDEEE